MELYGFSGKVNKYLTNIKHSIVISRFGIGNLLIKTLFNIYTYKLIVDIYVS